MRRIALIVAWLTITAGMVGCAPPPSPSPEPEPEPSPPARIAGIGTTTVVLDHETEVIDAPPVTADATFSLEGTGNGGYSGVIDYGDAGSATAVLATSGRRIQTLQGDAILDPVPVTDVFAVRDNPRCPGEPALHFGITVSAGDVYGQEFVDLYGTGYLVRSTWTVCDSVAAVWFGVPRTIEGEGTVEDFVVDPELGEASRGAEDVTFSLESNWHGVYSGEFSGFGFETPARIFTTGHHIGMVDTPFYSAGVTSVARITDAERCPGEPALQIEFFVDGSSYGEDWEDYTFRNLWTVCDPLAADWFG